MYFINKIVRWLSPLRAVKVFAGKLLRLKPLLPRFFIVFDVTLADMGNGTACHLVMGTSVDVG